VLSFFLMFVIMAVATDTRAVGEAAAIAIGGTIGLDAMFGGPISGASMNPMRSLGPALVSGDLHALWLYILAPIVGTSLGAVADQFVRGEQPRTAELAQTSARRKRHDQRVVRLCRQQRPLGNGRASVPTTRRRPASDPLGRQRTRRCTSSAGR
jgi:hypothetical protein